MLWKKEKEEKIPWPDHQQLATHSGRRQFPFPGLTGDPVRQSLIICFLKAVLGIKPMFYD